MKKQFLPYYISRALLSIVLSLLVAGLTWKAAILAVILFGLFLLYLHSGWFQIEARNPLFPIRRDERGQQVQRNALIIAVIVGLFAYLLLNSVVVPLGLAARASSIALGLAILAYFASQFLLFSKA